MCDPKYKSGGIRFVFSFLSPYFYLFVVKCFQYLCFLLSWLIFFLFTMIWGKIFVCVDFQNLITHFFCCLLSFCCFCYKISNLFVQIPIILNLIDLCFWKFETNCLKGELKIHGKLKHQEATNNQLFFRRLVIILDAAIFVIFIHINLCQLILSNEV